MKSINFNGMIDSSTALFITVMDVNMDADYVLPDCPNFFNIFHPYDPVAYRFEPLIDSNSAKNYPSVLIPHYTGGGRRLHLSESRFPSRLNKPISLYQYTSIEMQDNLKTCLDLMRSKLRKFFGALLFNKPKRAIVGPVVLTPLCVGKLNGGKRIDYVLQEAPLESINEYIFSVSSHLMYWYVFLHHLNQFLLLLSLLL